MLSHAQSDRSRVISYHLQDIGIYLITVGYNCYRENNHGVLLSEDQVGTYMQWCWFGYVGPVRVD